MSDCCATKVATDDVVVNRKRGGEIRVLLSPKTVGATTGLFGVAHLQPGEYIAEHRHPYSEEHVYVAAGEAVARVDGDQELKLETGEAVSIPINVRHRFENRGSEQLHLVFALSPLAPRPDLGHVDTEPLPGQAGEGQPDAR